MGPVSAHVGQVTNTTSSTGGSYVSISPSRICDTRSNQPANPCTGSTLTTGATLQVQVPTTVVPAGASAVVLNVTAVDPSAAGFLSVFPGGATVPTGSSLVSNLNFAAGATVANLVTVGLSSTGTVEIYNYTGDTNVVVDVEGYYTSTPASNGSGLYNAISPTRVLGTLASGATIAANTATAVTVAGGSTGVPASATAVVVNLTAADATAASFLTAFPAGVTMPLASNLNFAAQVPNQAIANRVTVGVGTGGQIMVYNHAGSVNVDVDVDGYYTGSGGTGSAFVAITPQRLTDTRSATNGTPIAASTSETFSLTNSSIPATAAAVAANFTVVPGADPGYLTVYPTADTTVPVASDVNWTASESPAVPNFTVADTAGTGNVAVFNSHGATINLLIDAFGYFGPSTTTPTMLSAAVTNAQIAITYNEAVSCPATGADGSFAYDWTGTAPGGTINGCSTSSTNGNVLDLTTSTSGGFTLPGSTGTSLTYTPSTSPNTTTNSVYATNDQTSFEAAQTLSIPAAATLPAMVSAMVGSSTTLLVTYNRDVTCGSGTPSGALGDFAYTYTGVASGGTLVACSTSGKVLTLTFATAIDAPTSSAAITYTAPTTNTTADSVYATGSSSPVLYAKTQTLSGSMWTAPTITAATVGTNTMTLTYNEPVLCPSTNGDVQAEFVYSNSNGTTAAYPSTCTPISTGTASTTVTLGGFMTTSTSTTTATLEPPGNADTLTYTAPSAPTTVNSINSANYQFYPASQTFDLTVAAAPAMDTAAGSAVVTSGKSIAITYNENVSCPATGANTDFVYDYSAGASGGTVTGCSTSGNVLTLTGAFNAPLGSATLTYTQPSTSPSSLNSVYATGNQGDLATSPDSLSGTQIS
jgi:hypothetical protein